MTFPITGQQNLYPSFSSPIGSILQADATGATSSAATNCPSGSQTSSAGTSTGQPQDLQQMLMLIADALKSLLQAISGSSTGGASPEPAAQTPPPNSPAPSTLASAAEQRNTTADPNQKQRLNDSLASIANDPEGSKLLQAAVSKGYSFEVGDPSAAGDHDEVNGITLPDQKKIIVNPNAPNFLKTLVHELVHAATDQDGDSKDEEGKADVIGFRVASRILGQTEPNEQATYQNKVTNPAYAGLVGNNNVDQSLSALGLTAFVA